MNALEKNLRAVVLEMALKMGLTDQPISLNYPLSSLSRLMGEELTAASAPEALARFFAQREALLGPAAAAPYEGGLCLTIPGEGVARIVAQAPAQAFLRELIREAQRPGATAQSLIAVFRRHSGHVHAQRVENAEFDWLVYFEDGVPDDDRYCIDEHDGFVSYHRYTREDYEAFGL